MNAGDAAGLPHPIRVLVKGSSLVVMVPDWNGDPGEYTFPRWIQNGLLDRGRPCELDNRGVAGELVQSIKSYIGVTSRVIVHPASSLERSSGKARRVTDRRPA